jgi:hypothetical protein
VRECVVNDRAFVGSDLQSKLQEINFPVSFLDFETYNPALPVYVGTSPYQQVPFQWSLHIKTSSGDLLHKSFLWSEQDDPREALLESLIDAIPREGTIVAYSNYEQRVRRDLAAEFPDFADALLGLCDRTFDLLKLIREEYYHPQFHGSFSIKSVLPVLDPDMGYGGLEIRHGLVAAIDFGRMIAESTSAEGKEATREALLAYCQRDTEAMVRVFDVLSSMTT